MQTVDGQRLAHGQLYELHPDLGVAAARWVGEAGAGPVVMDGAVLDGIEQALGAPSPVPPLMAACLPALSELKAVLRTLIHYHLGSQTLRTRQFMMELQQP